MSSLDFSIPMSVQPANVLGALAAGQQAGANANEFQRQNALMGAIDSHGPGMMAGDPAALNVLARFDPQSALNVQDTRQTMDARAQAMEQARAQARQQAEQHAMNISADQATQAATRLDGIIQGAVMAPDEQAYNAWLQQNGMDPTTMPFAQRDMYAAQAMGTLDVLKARADQAAVMAGPDPMAQIELETAQIGLDNLRNPPAPEAPAAFQTLTARAQAAGLQPGTPEYQAFMVNGGAGPDTVINNNMPDPSGGVTDKFYENLDTAQAEMFGTLLNAGMSAPARLAQVDELDSLLAQSPSGIEAAAKTWLGNRGVETTGLSSLQAAQALISRLVPEQRAPGSGPMSDADLALFRESLPRLVNTPEGNATIASTIRGLIVYEQQQAQIANRVASREITPAEGRAQLMALDNPLQVFQTGTGATQIQGDWQDMGDGTRIRRIE